MSTESGQLIKILITAMNSYIGNSFADWVANDPKYSVEFITCRDDDWKKRSFSGVDVILHVAGIAHVEAKSDQKSMYYKINKDLTIELAKKAKSEGVNQFIFMSSMIVFGESNAQNRNIVVTSKTRPNPSGFYGDSKWQAEQGIVSLQESKFNVVIIRPPMIYGKGSKGNFPKLARLAKKTIIFPRIDNNRSMLYIDNLCEFIRLMIDNEEHGYFHPQNQEYVNTTELVYSLGLNNGQRIAVTRLFNPAIKILGKKLNQINKLFGTFVYDKKMSIYKDNYWVSGLDDSLKLTERGDK